MVLRVGVLVGVFIEGQGSDVEIRVLNVDIAFARLQKQSTVAGFRSKAVWHSDGAAKPVVMPVTG